MNLAFLNTAGNVRFREMFVDCLEKKFSSEVFRRDFSKDLPATMKEIHDKVSESTHGRCKNYKPSISELTICSLYNIPYLKERWERGSVILAGQISRCPAVGPKRSR